MSLKRYKGTYFSVQNFDYSQNQTLISSLNLSDVIYTIGIYPVVYQSLAIFPIQLAFVRPERTACQSDTAIYTLIVNPSLMTIPQKKNKN